MKANVLSILGVVATIAGGAAALLGNWVTEKKMDETIEIKVNEALERRNENEEEETEEE